MYFLPGSSSWSFYSIETLGCLNAKVFKQTKSKTNFKNCHNFPPIWTKPLGFPLLESTPSLQSVDSPPQVGNGGLICLGVVLTTTKEEGMLGQTWSESRLMLILFWPVFCQLVGWCHEPQELTESRRPAIQRDHRSFQRATGLTLKISGLGI